MPDASVGGARIVDSSKASADMRVKEDGLVLTRFAVSHIVNCS